jgi:hypothetical protein
VSRRKLTPEDRDEIEALRKSGEEARAYMQEILDRIEPKIEAYRAREERRERRRARIRRLLSFRRAA